MTQPDSAVEMAKTLTQMGKKFGLSVRVVRHTTGDWYEVRNGKDQVYRAQQSEEVAAYFGRLEIAARFK